MKDCSKELLEEGRPDIDTLEGIDFCLSNLYKDRKHFVTEEFVRGLTFEELVGVLLLAKDAVNEYNSLTSLTYAECGGDI